MSCFKWWNAKANDAFYVIDQKIMTKCTPRFHCFCYTASFFFLLKPQWKPSYCSSILSFLCFLHSGFIFLGTKAINIWRTFSIFIVYLCQQERPTIVETGLPLVFVIMLILLFLLIPESPCFSLQECEIMNMTRAETVQNDMLTLEPLKKESIERPWGE